MTDFKSIIDEKFHSQKYKQKREIDIAGRQLTLTDVSCLINEKNFGQVKILGLNYYCLPQPILVKQLAKGNWNSLQKLAIGKNFDQSGDDMCRELAKLQAQNLRVLYIWQNNIGVEGCLHLVQSNWRNLSCLYLGGNKIENDGCEIISKSNWNLTQLEINKNSIDNTGIKQLSKTYWPDLCLLNLSDNKIGDTGCKWLSQIQWSRLKKLDIQRTCIAEAGCRWISKARWRQLTFINLNELQNNKIGWQSCQCLSHCDWPEIYQLFIENNGFGDEGRLYLVKSVWKKVKRINTWGNDIQNNDYIRSLSYRSFPSTGSE